MEQKTVTHSLTAYEAVETAAQLGVAAYYVQKPTLPLKAKLQHVASDKPLPRWHHSLVVIGTNAYVFGGETGHHIAKDDHETTEWENERKIAGIE